MTGRNDGRGTGGETVFSKQDLGQHKRGKFLVGSEHKRTGHRSHWRASERGCICKAVSGKTGIVGTWYWNVTFRTWLVERWNAVSGSLNYSDGKTPF